jgi:glycine oxidase
MGVSERPEIVVVGGGAIGCSIAYYVAKAGARVTLLERGTIGSESTGAAAGMLAPITEKTGQEAFLTLGLRSMEMFSTLAPELEHASGVDIELMRSGILRVVYSQEEEEELRAATAWQRDLNLGVSWLKPEEAYAREPALAPGLRCAVYSPSEQHVNPSRLAQAFAKAAVTYGAALREGAVVDQLRVHNGAVEGVVLSTGERLSGHVVLAGGAWSAVLAQQVGLDLPVRPVRGQMVALSAPGFVFRHILWGERVYLMQKADGSIWAGGTIEEAGFDRRVTVAGVGQMLQAAAELVPALADATFLRAWAGLRPGSPDNMPIIGPAPGVPGLTLATGHFRNGILLAPITGQLIADWLTEGRLDPMLETFGPSRFASRISR